VSATEGGITVARKALFTPWREKLSDGFVRYEVAQAREHDRDSYYGPYARLQTTTPDFERWGRRYVRMFSLDVMAEEAGAPRGGAISIKPSEATEYRMFLKEWQKVQWAREDAYDDGDGEDVPLRAVLGGMQRFTHGVKTRMPRTGMTISASSRRRRTGAPRATRHTARRRKPPASSCGSRRY